jgi:hypothetical protein
VCALTVRAAVSCRVRWGDCCVRRDSCSLCDTDGVRIAFALAGCYLLESGVFSVRTDYTVSRFVSSRPN